MSVTPTPAPTPAPPPAPVPAVLPAPTLTVEYIGGLVAMVVGLFATQGLISNNVEKIITGSASILVPLIVIGIQAFVKSQAHKANAVVVAARLAR